MYNIISGGRISLKIPHLEMLILKIKQSMKKYFSIIITAFVLFMASCGGSMKIDNNLSSDEAKAVVATEKSLPRGVKIESYEVVKSKLPLALLESEYKNMRDKINKAQIDYKTNMTRGLQEVAQKNLETIKNCQVEIAEKAANLNATSPEYIFVLASVKESQRKDGKLTGVITIFDPSTLEKVDFIQVTTPLFNNAVMVTKALEGSLANPTDNFLSNENLESTNPVVNFILHSNPK